MILNEIRHDIEIGQGYFVSQKTEERVLGKICLSNEIEKVYQWMI